MRCSTHEHACGHIGQLGGIPWIFPQPGQLGGKPWQLGRSWSDPPCTQRQQSIWVPIPTFEQRQAGAAARAAADAWLAATRRAAGTCRRVGSAVAAAASAAFAVAAAVPGTRRRI